MITECKWGSALASQVLDTFDTHDGAETDDRGGGSSTSFSGISEESCGGATRTELLIVLNSSPRHCRVWTHMKMVHTTIF